MTFPSDAQFLEAAKGCTSQPQLWKKFPEAAPC